MKLPVTALALILATCSACAGTLHDNAVTATNTTQSVLTALDLVWAPIVQEQIDQAKTLDDAAYKKHMQRYITVTEAIEQARRASLLMNLAIQTWDAAEDEGALFQTVAPCVLLDVQLIREMLQPHIGIAPPQLSQALVVIESVLGGLVEPGAVCGRPKPDPAPVLVIDPPPPPEPAATLPSLP